MKVAVFGPARRVGIVHDDVVLDINGAYAKYLAETSDITRPVAHAAAEVPAELNAFIEEGTRALDGARKALDHLSAKAYDERGVSGEQLRFRLDEVVLHAPLEGRSRIFCALANFADHMDSAAQHAHSEEQAKILSRLQAGGPKFFLKDSRAAAAAGQPVRYPARTQRLDYEAEVAVVIGKRGRDISRSEFGSYIWGYALHNDWSIRDNVSFGPDFGHAKNFDTAASIGPWIVVDEGIDPQDIPIECRVNGELRQRGNTASMVHDFAAFAQYLSADTTFWPGDLISSGTPKGTAVDSSPQLPDGTHADTLFVKPGDVVEISSSLIGAMRNEVVAPA